ncbi:MAG: AAA family ATPase [Pseudonocardiaceae bacterium]
MTFYRTILVSGLTAAGKTTHSKLLAEDLGWSYVDMASVRKEILGEQLVFSERDREWTPSHDQLRAADINIDLEADQRMAAIVADRSNIVVDAWLQPWLYQAGDALRIWIESSVETRIMKTAVATMRRGEVPSSRIADVLAAKDEFSRAHFQRLYSIDLYGDPAIFTMMLNNSRFIDEPSIDKSDAGIAAFRPVLRRQVQLVLQRTGRPDGN